MSEKGTLTKHDCVAGRCDTDVRTSAEVEAEGFAAGLLGASYDDVPYGHTHPDVRFSSWQRGRWKAIGEWCYQHRQWHLHCITDREDDPTDDEPCSMSGGAV